MQTVGERLRNERERKGATLKDIENVTNIRSLYLQAIENGNYAVLPGEAYVKGFIRNYANALGLNGAEYVDFYRKDQQPAPALATVDNERIVAKPQEAHELPITTRSVSIQRRQRSRRIEIMCVGIFLFLLIVCGGLWWHKSIRQDKLPPQISTQDPQQQTQIEITQQPVRVAPLPPESPVAKSVVVEANFVSRSWVQVIADGAQIYEGIPEVGKSVTWKAEQQMILKAGNAGGVELSYNGQPIGRLGSNGEVIVKTFTNTTADK